MRTMELFLILSAAISDLKLNHQEREIVKDPRIDLLIQKAVGVK